MKKVIYICYTYYQVIMATHLAITLKKNCENILIFSNHSSNSRSYFDNAKKNNIFNKIYFARIMKIQKNNLLMKIKIVLYSLIRKNIAFNELDNHFVDEVIVHNNDFAINILIRHLKKINKNIEINRIEEGILSYNNLNQKDYSYFSFIKYLVGLKDIDRISQNLYCTYEKLYSGLLPTIKIPLIDLENKRFKDTISSIFNIQTNNLFYPQKYIFFTSVFDFEGGEAVGELELAKRIAELVGKENFLVKVHPRDNVERFKKEGLNVDTNSSVPWEVIQLNYDFSNHVFITVCSTSVLNVSSIVLNPPVTIFAYKLVKYKNNNIVLNSIKSFESLRTILANEINFKFIKVIDNLSEITLL